MENIVESGYSSPDVLEGVYVHIKFTTGTRGRAGLRRDQDERTRGRRGGERVQEERGRPGRRWWIYKGRRGVGDRCGGYA